MPGPEASEDEREHCADERAAEERELKKLQRVAQRVNERVTGHFGVIRKAESGWGKRSCGCQLGGEERLDVCCFIKGIGESLPQRCMFSRGRSFRIRSCASSLGLRGHTEISRITSCSPRRQQQVLQHCEGSALSPFDLRLNRLAAIKSFTEPATIWDLTPPERDPVPSMPRMVACREKVFAFAMGLHPRLGAQVSPQRKVGGQESLRMTVMLPASPFLEFLCKI